MLSVCTCYLFWPFT